MLARILPVISAPARTLCARVGKVAAESAATGTSVSTSALRRQIAAKLQQLACRPVDGTQAVSGLRAAVADFVRREKPPQRTIAESLLRVARTVPGNAVPVYDGLVEAGVEISEAIDAAYLDCLCRTGNLEAVEAHVTAMRQRYGGLSLTTMLQAATALLETKQPAAAASALMEVLQTQGPREVPATLITGIVRGLANVGTSDGAQLAYGLCHMITEVGGAVPFDAVYHMARAMAQYSDEPASTVAEAVMRMCPHLSAVPVARNIVHAVLGAFIRQADPPGALRFVHEVREKGVLLVPEGPTLSLLIDAFDASRLRHRQQQQPQQQQQQQQPQQSQAARPAWPHLSAASAFLEELIRGEYRLECMRMARMDAELAVQLIRGAAAAGRVAEARLLTEELGQRHRLPQFAVPVYTPPPALRTHWLASERDLLAAQSLLLAAPAVGLDTEAAPVWNGLQRPRLALLQLATAAEVFLVDALALSKSAALADLLSRLFQSDSVLKLGVSIAQDAIGVYRAGLVPAHVATLRAGVELSLLFRDLVGTGLGHSLARMTTYCLGRRLDKRQQMSNWEVRPLRAEQVHYAVADARVALDLFDALRSALGSRYSADKYVREYTLNGSAAEAGPDKPRETDS